MQVWKLVHMSQRLEYSNHIPWNICRILYSNHIPWNISGIFHKLVTWWNISGIFQIPIWKRYVWGGVRTGPATYHCEGGGHVTVVVLYVWCCAVPLLPWRVQHPWGQGVIQRRNFEAVGLLLEYKWNIPGKYHTWNNGVLAPFSKGH